MADKKVNDYVYLFFGNSLADGNIKVETTMLAQRPPFALMP